MASGNKLLDVASVRVACGDCSLSKLCVPMGLEAADMDRLDTLMKRPRPLRRGEHLFRAGDRFHSIYAVRSGSVKSYTPCHDGSEQVIGFHLPGELVGLDAIESEEHVCAARVLETTSVCVLPFDRIQEIACEVPSLQRQFHQFVFTDEFFINDDAPFFRKYPGHASVFTQIAAVLG